MKVSTITTTKTNDELIKKLTRAVSYRFKDDGSAAGVTLSFLPTGKFYGSIVRYKSPFGKNKEVAFKVTHADLSEVLKSLANFVVSTPKVKNPLDELNEVLKGV